MKISNLTKMAESYPNGKKTLWEKEKLLITSNFSFSHSVFKRLVSQGRQKVSLCGNGLSAYTLYRHFNPFPNKPWFLGVFSTSLLKTLRENEKLLLMTNFSFCHSVFYPFIELSVLSIEFEIAICKFLDFEKVYNLSFGKGLNSVAPTNDFLFLACPFKCRIRNIEANFVTKPRHTSTKNLNETVHTFFVEEMVLNALAPPGWLSGERVRLMTWWL